MSNKNKSTVEKLAAALRANDLETFLSFYTNDVRWTKVGEKSVVGKDDLRRLVESLGNAPLPSEVTFDAMIAEGDYVMAYGHLISMDEDGKTAPRTFCDVYRFRDDKIAELTVFLIEAGLEAERGA